MQRRIVLPPTMICSKMWLQQTIILGAIKIAFCPDLFSRCNVHPCTVVPGYQAADCVYTTLHCQYLPWLFPLIGKHILQQRDAFCAIARFQLAFACSTANSVFGDLANVCSACSSLNWGPSSWQHKCSTDCKALKLNPVAWLAGSSCRKGLPKQVVRRQKHAVGSRRPSCFGCPAQPVGRQSDCTLGREVGPKDMLLCRMWHLAVHSVNSRMNTDMVLCFRTKPSDVACVPFHLHTYTFFNASLEPYFSQQHPTVARTPSLTAALM